MGFIVTAWRENRNRRWASEDRIAATREIVARAAAEAEATRIKTESVAETLRLTGVLEAAKLREDNRISAETLRLETLAAANVVRESALRDSAEMMAKIDGAAQASREAEKVANNVNEKIANLQEHLSEAERRAAPLDAMKRTGEDTNAIATDIRAAQVEREKREGER